MSSDAIVGRSNDVDHTANHDDTGTRPFEWSSLTAYLTVRSGSETRSSYLSPDIVHTGLSDEMMISTMVDL